MNLKLWKKKSTSTPIVGNQISINKTGHITFSEELEKHFNDGAEVFYDSEAKIIALKPSESLNAYRISRQAPRNKTKRICVRKLLLTLNVKQKRYVAEWNQTEKMLVFQYEEQTVGE